MTDLFFRGPHHTTVNLIRTRDVAIRQGYLRGITWHYTTLNFTRIRDVVARECDDRILTGKKNNTSPSHQTDDSVAGVTILIL